MNFQNKKVLILGLGLNEGGVGSAKFFAKKGADVLVTDIKSEDELKPSVEKLKEFKNIKYHLGGHKNEDIDWADLVIKNQAIKPGNPFLKYAREKGKDIQTDIGIFLEYVRSAQIIGITGTKGKSTTSSLIYEILHKNNLLHLRGVTKKVILTGNIGKSVLDSVDQITSDTLVVLEISSFQLESFDAFKVSPKYSVITNIYPDHLNYYSSMDEYVNAKKLIAKYQSLEDYLFINKEDEILISDDFLKGIIAKIVFYSGSDLPKDFKPQLPGEYNLSNLAAAFAVSKALKIDQQIALKALENFQGVEFRMQLIKEWNGIKIYNNTTATAPEPTIESLKTFPNCILIAGGMDKGLAYDEFAKAIDKYAKEVYFLEGDATKQLKAKSQKFKDNKTYNDLEILLNDVKQSVKAGDIILFSPGGTSFNLFQNEFDRGRKFNASVEKVFN